jgi:NADPH-dependent glutamate synthase beta subunit-like oxidoreductase
VKTGRGNTIQVDKDLATSRQGVFAGGDVQIGPASVIEAIAAGRMAARSIDRYLGGRGEIDEVLVEPEEFPAWFGRDEGYASWGAPEMPTIPKDERGGYREVELGYPEDVAIREAKRCLHCDSRLRVACVPWPAPRVPAEV